MNSFAPIDGGQIQREAINRLFVGLSAEAQTMVRAVQRVLKAPLGLPLDRKLVFYEMVTERDRNKDLDHLGLDLWQVGLIADGGGQWMARLGRNRDATLQISRPRKLQSSTVERVDALGVDRSTRAALIKFLQHTAVNDVATWSHSLSNRADITLDRWVFPQEDQSDLVNVSVTPFVNPQGVVERYSNLKQPDGVNGLLYASYGTKESITVRWKSDPPKPLHLHQWRIEFIPANDYIADEDNEIDLPVREVSASRRSFKISLDMDLAAEDLPDYPLCIRLTPLDKSGNPLRHRPSEDEPDSVEISAHSQEFYLSNEPTPPKPVVLTSSRRSTPTIAFGRIEALLDATSGQELLEREPQWNAAHTIFSLRVSERRVINLALSPLLAEIERMSLAAPSQLQRYDVALEQLRPILPTDVSPQALTLMSGDTWTKWMSARKAFFEALMRQSPRSTVATADWGELAELGRRYGEAYHRLLKDMLDSQVSAEALREFYTLDTIAVKIEGQYGTEEALVLLPIHPIRVAWTAAYTQLLRHWEETLALAAPKMRKSMIDTELLRALEPANVPPFAFHPERAEAFLNLGNLGFYYGIYLPAPFADSERRLGDLALLLGVDAVSSLVTSDALATQLSKHLKTFQELHPYVDTLGLSLVGTHYSPWVSEALGSLTRGTNPDEDDSASLPPALSVTAYVARPETVSGVSGIDRLRQLFSERGARRSSDHLHPTIASAIVPLQKLLTDDADDVHLAIVSDLVSPGIVPVATATQIGGTHSLSVYGLVVRFISSYVPSNGKPRWVSAIALPEAYTHEHPSAPRYSNTLLDLYRVMQRVAGAVLTHDPEHWPAVAYELEQQEEQHIHQVHASADWVVTADRFFALDYYDSPQNPTLQPQSRTYLLDYAPEFADGIGRRMFITTRWRGEVELLLATAMRELGFDQVETSVGQLLHHLKTISGQLALQLTRSDTSAAAAVGLGVVTAYLKQRRELESAVLIPIDSASRLFSRTMNEGIKKGERRCDLLLLAMKRNTIDATFIEVKWRRGTSSFDSLAIEMEAQMRSTAEVMSLRYFTVGRSSKEASDERADGVLQRAYLANVIRFYVERAYRYGLLTDEAYRSFTDHLRGIERPTYEFRPKYRGFIVTLEKVDVPPLMVGEAMIEVISAADVTVLSIAPTSEKENTSASDPSARPSSLSPLNQPSKVVLTVMETTNASEASVATPAATDAPNKGLEEISEGLALSPSVTTSTTPSEISITLGETARGLVDWKPSVRGSPHLFIVGIPGQGKSVTINHILVEMARQHVPALVLDFHGQFGDPTGAFVAASGSQSVDAAQGLPFSPFEVIAHNGKTDWKQNSAVLADIFAYVVGLGGIQKDLLLNAIQDAYKAGGFATEDASEQALPTTEQVLKNIEQREQKQKVRNVAARCRPLLEMELFKPPTGKSDLLAQIRQGLVIDLHDLMSETLQLAAGAFVLRKLYRDMFTWGQASHLRLAIVLDEAHRLAKDVTLPKLMKEGRKYGISVVVASQGLSDFHPDILGNAGAKVIFRTNYPESKKIAPYLQPRNPQDVAARIEQLAVGTAVVQTPDMQQGAVVQMRSSELGDPFAFTGLNILDVAREATMPLNTTRAQQLLRSFDLTTLFIEELGWDRHSAAVEAVVEGQRYTLVAVAQKRGVVAFTCSPAADGRVPPGPVRREIERYVASMVREHLIIFHDAARAESIWQWVRREAGQPTVPREEPYHRALPGQRLLQRLQGIAFRLDEEADLTLTDVVGRVRSAFDVEAVTRRFYEGFQAEHAAFTAIVTGIDEPETRRWYTSVMLNRLMFTYFVQKKGFLDGDPDYLRSHFVRTRRRGSNRYYQDFLQPLFFEGLARPRAQRSAKVIQLLGEVPYLNGGLFQLHRIEIQYGGRIAVADAAFEGSLNFFDRYRWHLDDRPLHDDSEINPEVLGYIFERYTNTLQKDMGAYYTKEDITGYIARNSIVPTLLDMARATAPQAFSPNGTIWTLLRSDSDRYIYADMRRGTELALPKSVATGIDDPGDARCGIACLPSRMHCLPKSGARWWHDASATRRCGRSGFRADPRGQGPDQLESRQQCDSGGYNRDDGGPGSPAGALECDRAGDYSRPTCGSGAFLFAGLNVLQPLYELCLDRMAVLLQEQGINGAESPALTRFRSVLEQVAQHPNRAYFVLKSIIVNNLYGLDLMEEAVEICKLRLFLKLAAQIEPDPTLPNMGAEPLPDIDFNVFAGNALVGYASYEEVRRAVGETVVGQRRLQFDETMERIAARVRHVDAQFSRFRQAQMCDTDASTTQEKRTLQRALDELDGELDRYLAHEYGVDAGNTAAFSAWRTRHAPFHWFVKFYRATHERGGFDVVIGNPPYVGYPKVKSLYAVRGYATEGCGNLYAFAIERSLNLLREAGRYGMIVPIASVSTEGMRDLQQLYAGYWQWHSHWAVRPGKLFVGVDMNLTISLLQKTREAARSYTTGYRRWSSRADGDRRHLFTTLSYTRNPEFAPHPNPYPKLGSMLEVQLLARMLRHGRKLRQYTDPTGAAIYYHSGGRYWRKALPTKLSSHYKAVQVAAPLKPVVFALLNSQLFYWYWIVNSNCMDVVSREVLDLPVFPLDWADPVEFGELMGRLLAAYYASNSTRVRRGQRISGEEINFDVAQAKPIIDEIDALLAGYYGFSDAELDFVLNYDIKYRVAAQAGE
ncbi:DUF87 domain-containing protein [Candidatus Gracilibacteria bacterium]|nr:DUF87 domain-containing protein [Candidatus Gracilibacteria bacterium]